MTVWFALCKLKYDVSSSSTHARKTQGKKGKSAIFSFANCKRKCLKLTTSLKLGSKGKNTLIIRCLYQSLSGHSSPRIFGLFTVMFLFPHPPFPPSPPSLPSLPVSLKNVTRLKKRVLTKRKITKYAPQRYNLNPSSPKRHQHQIYPCHIEQILPTTPTGNVWARQMRIWLEGLKG